MTRFVFDYGFCIFFFFIIVKRLIKICKYSFWKLEDGIIKRNEGEFCKILSSYAKSHDCQKKESFGKNIFFTAVILELFKIGYLRKQEILAILLPDFQDLTILFFLDSMNTLNISIFDIKLLS